MPAPAERRLSVSITPAPRSAGVVAQRVKMPRRNVALRLDVLSGVPDALVHSDAR